MRKQNQPKRKMYILLVLIIILFIGIGYAILTQQLTIDNTISYDSMKWEVGFSSTQDNGGTITSTSSIGSDGKSITVNCDFGTSTSQESCIVKAAITNNSTFDIALINDPIITYDDTYIHTLTFKWNNHPTYENYTVYKDNFIAKGETEEVILTIQTKNLNEDMLPSNDISIPITITLNFAEWRNGSLPTTSDLSILKSTTQSDTTAFRSSTYKTKIKNITFEKEINIPNNAIESWDIGVSQNGNVMAYVTPNAIDSSYYDLYIQSNTQLYANTDMSYWFYNLTYVDSINGLELLDTYEVTNMSYMFYNTGKNSKSFTLNLGDKFYTSNVSGMSYMFYYTGYSSTAFMLELGDKFDTSKVTSMNSMFWYTGYSSTTFVLDLGDKFDTSKVTNMSSMFHKAGYSNTTFTLDLGDKFDTSNVTNMNSIFAETGYNSTIFTLDLGDKFDTSNVTSMNGTFFKTGYNNPIFTLDLGDKFDTSKVTNMGVMFYMTGHNSTNFTLDLGDKFDTSNVTGMSQMFYWAGSSSPKFNITITIKNPNTSSYSEMFYGTARTTGSKIIVNYTSETSDLVDEMIATKTAGANVVKGVQVD